MILETRYKELQLLDNTAPRDRERQALFYIISANNELWGYRNDIYDFKRHQIKFDLLESGICTSSMKMLKLGFNLYNNFNTETSVLDTFCSFDDSNFEIAMMALRIRLNQVQPIEPKVRELTNSIEDLEMIAEFEKNENESEEEY